MNQSEIVDRLNSWLDEGFDVQAILNQTMTIRTGEASVAALSREFVTNSQYLFGVKTPDECFNEDWKWHCINIVKKDYWKSNGCVADCHLSGKIHLPPGFDEEMESTFSYDASASRDDVIRKLNSAGFQHSVELQECMQRARRHDP